MTEQTTSGKNQAGKLQRAALIERMLGLLRDTLIDLGVEEGIDDIASTSPLIGTGTVITSLGLVSVIADVEMSLAEEDGLELTLVSEDALSRSSSPFRTIEALADYVLELVKSEGAQ
jgi:hypothetical protein